MIIQEKLTLLLRIKHVPLCVVRHTQQTTAGHPHCLHAGGSVAGSAGRVAPRGRRHELLLLWGPSFLHWVNMSHLSSWVEPNWWSLPCWTVLHWIATSGMFLGYGWACIQLRPGHAWAPLRCSGGTSNLGVDAGLRGRLSSSLHADGLEGWCSPRCFGPRTASGRCCGDGDSPLVRVSGLRGVCWPSNAHEDGRPVALKTDLDCTKKKKKWTSLLDKQADQPLTKQRICEPSTAL